MAKKKLLLIITILSIITVTSVYGLSVSNTDSEVIRDYIYDIDPTSNFFTQVETYEPVEVKAIVDGYTKIAQSENLELFIKEETMSIAVRVAETGYVWYSEYPDLESFNYTEGLENYVKSGVTIEYFNASTLYENQANIIDNEAEVTYEYYLGGFIAHIDFVEEGIAFDVDVKITSTELKVNIPSDSIVETKIEKKSLKVPIENKLKAIQVFPFFGAENYEIDGYSFIPDGSGALIRYEDTPNTTAFKARVYGDDYGYRNDIELYDHLRETSKIGLPIYGVVHGVEQNGFFTEVTSGDSMSELNSYPYQYLTDFNTTFMKFIYREKYVVRFSSSDETGIALIDEEPSKEDVSMTYSFLSGNEASYLGMANHYKNELSLESETTSGSIPVRLEMIGLEYKEGLFGKNYIPMTRYDDVIEILDDLEDRGVLNNTVVYRSFNKNGFYDNSPIDPKTSRKLGGNSDYEKLVEYMYNEGMTLELYNDSFISFDNTFNNDLANQVTLKLFEMNSDSPLFDYYYYRLPALIADPFIDNLDRYQELGEMNVAIGSVGNTLFSYRENQQYVPRTDAVKTIVDELSQISEEFNVSLYEPNGYALPYIERYYDIQYESNRYPFITDSVPFLQIVLSGHVEMYSEYANFVSDYHLYALRLIEYGVSPSFILTYEPTHKLRYTNSEHIYTSEYALWADHIEEIYSYINDGLKHVYGEEIIDYKYVSEGVSVITYSNDVSIIVNYTDQEVLYEGVTISALDYAVKGDDING